MSLKRRRVCAGIASVVCLVQAVSAQAPKSYTWAEVRDRFQAANPNLRAGQIDIEESRAQEITAYLRPNPDLTLAADQIQPFNANPYRPLTNLLTVASVTYLHERQHKRELRLESAQKATNIAELNQNDLVRTMMFSLRQAFVQTLQAKAVHAVAEENLQYYDRVIQLSRERKQAGDIAQVDLDRIELQRVQFETDVQNSAVNLRTAKIQLLTLLNDRTPVDQFDVNGTFDFSDQVPPLEQFRQTALETRPDLKAAVATIEKARTDHTLAVANGSADPTFGIDYGRNPPFPVNYIGVSVSVPLRIFDKNQGEKLRTEREIARTEQLRTATEAQVFSDVDSAYATLNTQLNLLRPYKATYLQQASRIRDTVSYAYQNGAASLLDFLQAQQEYRAIQVTYLNLIGSYMNAASQLNLAVGREVLQ